MTIIIKSIFFLLFTYSLINPIDSLHAGENNDTTAPRFKVDVIRINYGDNYSTSIQQIIKLNGLMDYYLPDNVKVEWTTVLTAPEIRDGLLTGSIDITSNSSMSFILALENNMPLVLLSSAAAMPMHIYSKNPKIVSIHNLNDVTKIAVTAYGSSPHLAFMAACKDLFGNAVIFNDKLVPIPLLSAMPFLENSNEFDLVVGFFPHTLQLEKISGVRMIFDLTSYIQKYGICSFFMTTRAFYNLNPALVEAFLKAANKAVEFMREQPSEAAELLAGLYKVEPQKVEAVLRAMTPHLEITAYDKVANLMYEAGILGRQPTKFKDLPNYIDIPK